MRTVLPVTFQLASSFRSLNFSIGNQPTTIIPVWGNSVKDFYDDLNSRAFPLLLGRKDRGGSERFTCSKSRYSHLLYSIFSARGEKMSRLNWADQSKDVFECPVISKWTRSILFSILLAALNILVISLLKLVGSPQRLETHPRLSLSIQVWRQVPHYCIRARGRRYI